MTLCEQQTPISALENEYTIKPSDLDPLVADDLSAPGGPETKRLTFGFLKTFFLMTDEDRDIQAHLQFQDGKKLKFGNSAQLTITYTGTESIIQSNGNGETITFRLDNTAGTPMDIMKLNPDTNTIGIGTAIINNTGGTTGLQFDPYNRAKFNTHTFFFSSIEVTSEVKANHLLLKDSISEPATEPGSAQIYIEPGNIVKIKFSNGTVKAFQLN